MIVGHIAAVLFIIGYLSYTACGTLLVCYTIEDQTKYLKPSWYWFVIGSTALLGFYITAKIFLNSL